ncbi:MAG: UDP-N-acetylmuramoyl-L-alanyl-D-glutamate--2,6-diaminopimelate ligase, partial [Gammaproteobacteria bacterium]|nr:UDP-N-acetylmuramoyl-L-alanyl-D-glutamate--2,6-diaminopimelate ligase [Gammaproteobacteria bacterium]
MVSTVWKLEILLEGFAKVPEALRNCEVNALITDSRQVEPGALFIALAGQTQNGADYIDQALQRGAVAVLQESGSIVHEVVIAMPQLRRQLGQIASRFYDHPSQQLKIAAVTGTDGKSSVSHFIAAAMERLEGRAAVLGTLGNRMCSGVSLSAAGAHTTPPPIELQKLLAEVAAAGGRSVALEASSHGIEQSRLAGTRVNCAVLTQLGRDHLDYHGTMEAYAAAKQALFEEPGLESLVLNLD